jgi:hypothetical protein
MINEFTTIVFRLQRNSWLWLSSIIIIDICARKPGQRKRVRNAKTYSSKKSKLNDCCILLKLVKFWAYHSLQCDHIWLHLLKDLNLNFYDHIWNLCRLPGMTCCPLLTNGGGGEEGFWAGYIFILFYLEYRNILVVVTMSF